MNISGDLWDGGHVMWMEENESDFTIISDSVVRLSDILKLKIVRLSDSTYLRLVKHSMVIKVLELLL